MRSTFEWCQFSRFLEERECRLISPNDDWSDSSASGRLKSNILMSFAEYERLNVAEKIRSKMLAQAKRGMWGGGVVPFGYDYDRELQQLIPNQEEAAVVNRVFDRVGALVPLGAIAAELNQSGLRTRIRRFRGSDRAPRFVGGKPFRADSLRLLIRNSIYRGAIRYGGREFRGLHEPLVSEGKWEMANAALAHPDHSGRRRLLARDKYVNLLKGIIVCASCGRAMLSKASGKVSAGVARYRYYSCRRRHVAQDEPKCVCGDLAAEGIEKAVTGILRQLGNHDALVDSLLNESSGAGRRQAQQIDKLNDLDRRLAKLGIQTANCVEVLAAEGARALTDDLNRKIRELGRQREALLVSREQQRQRLFAHNNCILSRERLRFALMKLGGLLPTMAAMQRRDLLRLILESVAVNRVPSIHGANRDYLVTIHLSLTALITAMERGGVGDDRMEKIQPYGHRTMEITADLAIGPRGRISLRRPFEAELGEPPIEIDGRHTKAPQNPIQRALAWKSKLRATPGLSIRGLAKLEGQSPASISLHLKLLTNAPEIVAFVRNLQTPEALQVFSYRSLLKMANADTSEQRELFVELCRALPSGSTDQECLAPKC
jgi:hypothetical protein